MNRCTEVLEEEAGALGSELGRGKGEGGAGAGQLPSPPCHVLPASTPSRWLYSQFVPLGSLEGALCKVKGLCRAGSIPRSFHSNKKNRQAEEDDDDGDSRF